MPTKQWPMQHNMHLRQMTNTKNPSSLDAKKFTKTKKAFLNEKLRTTFLWVAKKETLVEMLCFPLFSGDPDVKLRFYFSRFGRFFLVKDCVPGSSRVPFFRPFIGDLFKGVKSDLHLGDQKLTNGRRW